MSVTAMLFRACLDVLSTEGGFTFSGQKSVTGGTDSIPACVTTNIQEHQNQERRSNAVRDVSKQSITTQTACCYARIAVSKRMSW
jgi:hypothetical protein